MLRPGAAAQVPSSLLRLGAAWAQWARLTRARVILDRDNSLAQTLAGVGRAPAHTALASRAAGRACVPVQGPAAPIQLVGRLGLPTGVTHDRTNPIHLLLLTGHPHGGGDIAAGKHGLGGQQVAGSPMSVERVGDVPISGRGRGRVAMRKQLGRIRITAFGALDWVARPAGLARGGKAGLAILGRGAPLGRGRQIRGAAPAHSGRARGLLKPDGTPGLDGRAPQPFRGRVWLTEGVQQRIAILANGCHEEVAQLGRFGEAILRAAHGGAVAPGRVELGGQPVGGHRSTVMQGVAQRVGPQGQAGAGAAGGQPGGRIAALAPTGLQHAGRDQGRKQERHQARFGTGCQQPGATIAQDGGSKTGGGALQRERIFPIPAGAPGRGRFGIAHRRDGLEHQHQRAAGRRLGRAAALALQIGKRGVGKKRPERLGQRQIAIARGKGRLGGPHRRIGDYVPEGMGTGHSAPPAQIIQAGTIHRSRSVNLEVRSSRINQWYLVSPVPSYHTSPQGEDTTALSVTQFQMVKHKHIYHVTSIRQHVMKRISW